MKKIKAQPIIGALCMFFFVCFVSAGVCHAEIPNTINYQGYLTDINDDPLTDWVKLTISLYDSEENIDPLWSETHDVFVQDGLFSLLLGSVTPLDLAFDTPYYLGIAVNEDPEMIPRYPLSSVAYAIASNGLQGPQGEPGPAGPQGDPGPQGIKGEKGDTGATGPQGPAGPKGDMGARGLQGEKGDTGERGPQGPKGNTGPTGPQGEQGPQGIQGPSGATGPEGPTGPQGETGAQGPPGMTWQGTWQAGVEYSPDDAVSHNGSSYICLVNHTASDGNKPPDLTAWDLLALKGDTGAVGPQGDQGLQGDPGPKGDKGDKGDQGLQGDPGPKGDKGDKGDQGPQGEKGETGEPGPLSECSNIITVANNGGDFTSIKDALDTITDASQANPYLILVAPGIYDGQVFMKPWITISGSGKLSTTLRFAGVSPAPPDPSDPNAPPPVTAPHPPEDDATVVGANNAEIRFLKIRNTNAVGYGIYNGGTSPNISDCIVTADNCGIYNLSGSPTISDCSITGKNGDGIWNKHQSNPIISNSAITGTPGLHMETLEPPASPGSVKPATKLINTNITDGVVVEEYGGYTYPPKCINCFDNNLNALESDCQPEPWTPTPVNP